MSERTFGGFLRARAAFLVAVGLVAFAALLLVAGVGRDAGVSAIEEDVLSGTQRIGGWLTGDRGHRATELAWQRRDAQPPLTGFFHGLAWQGLGGTLGGRGAVSFVSLLAGLVGLLAVAWWGARRFGLLAAAVGGALLVLAPGFLAQLRAAGPEPVFEAALVLLVIVAAQADRSRSAALLTALVFVLVTGTHATGLLFVVPLVLHAVVRNRTVETGEGFYRLGPFPVHALLGVVLALVLLAKAWPWTDIQTGKRLFEYLTSAFREHHPDILVFGEVVRQAEGSGPPLWMTLVLWLTRIPVPLLALAAVGFGRGVVALRANADTGEPATATLRLATLFTATLFAIQSLNGSPWYDGTDGILVAFPLLALLAVGGTRWLWELIAARRRYARAFAIAFLVLVLGGAGLARLRAGDDPNGYYNGLAGGAAGAVAAGLPRYPGARLGGDLLAWLRQPGPRPRSVAFVPDESRLRALASALRDMNALPPDLFVGEPFAADLLVVIDRPAAGGYAAAMELTSRREPVLELFGPAGRTAAAYRIRPPKGTAHIDSP